MNKISGMEKIIIKLSESPDINPDMLLKFQKQTAKEDKTKFFKNDELLLSYHNLVKMQKISPRDDIENLLRTRNVRSMSGIVVVSVLTKPYDCPGKCLYCPQEIGMPKSYLSNEPAVMRAVLNDFDPYKQTKCRLTALKQAGHPVEKINIRVIGGTWSYYRRNYQTWFIKRCFEACNEFENKNDEAPIMNRDSLEELQEINESVQCKIVEISIETRQDYINVNEIKRLRKLGVTKVELGVQSLYNDVLEKNRRGHDVEETVRATKLLKNAGFKVSYQMMANLPGSNMTMDKMMFAKLFEDERFKPDYLKIYPLALVKEAPIYELYKKKEFKPYDEAQLKELIKDIKVRIPKYCRVERIIRDIPATSIVEGGTKITNLRQIIQQEMEKENIKCKCIRCREIKNGIYGEDVILKRIDYIASKGSEIFLSFETKEDKLISLLRLRIPNEKNSWKILNRAALIREVHTYGQQMKISEKSKTVSQHRGLGRRLIEEAEKIVREESKNNKIVVISGVGVRNYFRKIGYELENTYMVKYL